VNPPRIAGGPGFGGPGFGGPGFGGPGFGGPRGVGPVGRPVASIRWGGGGLFVGPGGGVGVRIGVGPVVIRGGLVGAGLPPFVVAGGPPIVVVAPPVTVVDSGTVGQPEPLPTTPPAGNTTALQIVSLDSGTAAQAGLKVNDIILQVDSTRTRSFEDLRIALSASKGNSQFVVFNPETNNVGTVAVAVVDTRIGASVLEVPVQVDDPAPAPAGQAGQPAPPAAAAARTAPQITAVGNAGANLAGLAAGDVILGVDGKWVTNEAELNKALAASKDGNSVLVIYQSATGKVLNYNVPVQNGSIGATIQIVPIEVQN